MTLNPVCIGPDQSIREAAQLMSERGFGMLPVCDHGRLIGTVTDRDLTVRGIAQGMNPDEDCVRKVMTGELVYGLEDQSIEDACRIMEKRQIRRLPVLDEDKHLVGIVSLGDVAVRTGSDVLAGEMIGEISKPARR
jgi:CBS domain-containing protein